MRPAIVICFISLFALTECSFKASNNSDQINLLPMYGRTTKSQAQLDADNEFLHQCDSIFKDRKIASKHYIQSGWHYFYANNLDISMKRFNQAWLLDSTNAEAYWGFGNLLGRQQKFQESIEYFERSVQLNPNISNIWLCMAISYGQLFYQTKDETQLNKAIECSKKAIAINPKNTQAYSQLTADYTYFLQKDSARKYLDITDKLDPNAINPEVRKLLNE